jgi:hypothetical protein
MGLAKLSQLTTQGGLAAGAAFVFPGVVSVVQLTGDLTSEQVFV